MGAAVIPGRKEIDMKQKILFLIHDLGQGGAEKVLINLVNNMDREKFDISVTVLFGGGVTEHLKEYIGVAFDDNGKTFRDFGVKFIPYCVICNKKRVVWCGNAALLNEQRLEKIITK